MTVKYYGLRLFSQLDDVRRDFDVGLGGSRSKSLLSWPRAVCSSGRSLLFCPTLQAAFWYTATREILIDCFAAGEVCSSQI